MSRASKSSERGRREWRACKRAAPNGHNDDLMSIYWTLNMRHKCDRLFATCRPPNASPTQDAPDRPQELTKITRQAANLSQVDHHFDTQQARPPPPPATRLAGHEITSQNNNCAQLAVWLAELARMPPEPAATQAQHQRAAPNGQLALKATRRRQSSGVEQSDNGRQPNERSGDKFIHETRHSPAASRLAVTARSSCYCTTTTKSAWAGAELLGGRSSQQTDNLSALSASSSLLSQLLNSSLNQLIEIDNGSSTSACCRDDDHDHGHRRRQEEAGPARLQFENLIGGESSNGVVLEAGRRPVAFSSYLREAGEGASLVDERDLLVVARRKWTRGRHFGRPQPSLSHLDLEMGEVGESGFEGMLPAALQKHVELCRSARASSASPTAESDVDFERLRSQLLARHQRSQPPSDPLGRQAKLQTPKEDATSRLAAPSKQFVTLEDLIPSEAGRLSEPLMKSSAESAPSASSKSSSASVDKRRRAGQECCCKICTNSLNGRPAAAAGEFINGPNGANQRDKRDKRDKSHSGRARPKVAQSGQVERADSSLPQQRPSSSSSFAANERKALIPTPPSGPCHLRNKSARHPSGQSLEEDYANVAACRAQKSRQALQEQHQADSTASSSSAKSSFAFKGCTSNQSRSSPSASSSSLASSTRSCSSSCAIRVTTTSDSSENCFCSSEKRPAGVLVGAADVEHERHTISERQLDTPTKTQDINYHPAAGKQVRLATDASAMGSAGSRAAKKTSETPSAASASADEKPRNERQFGASNERYVSASRAAKPIGLKQSIGESETNWRQKAGLPASRQRQQQHYKQLEEDAFANTKRRFHKNPIDSLFPPNLQQAIVALRLEQTRDSNEPDATSGSQESAGRRLARLEGRQAEAIFLLDPREQEAAERGSMVEATASLARVVLSRNSSRPSSVADSQLTLGGQPPTSGQWGEPIYDVPSMSLVGGARALSPDQKYPRLSSLEATACERLHFNERQLAHFSPDGLNLTAARAPLKAAQLATVSQHKSASASHFGRAPNENTEKQLELTGLRDANPNLADALENRPTQQRARQIEEKVTWRQRSEPTTPNPSRVAQQATAKTTRPDAQAEPADQTHLNGATPAGEPAPKERQVKRRRQSSDNIQPVKSKAKQRARHRRRRAADNDDCAEQGTINRSLCSCFEQSICLTASTFCPICDSSCGSSSAAAAAANSSSSIVYMLRHLKRRRQRRSQRLAVSIKRARCNAQPAAKRPLGTNSIIDQEEEDEEASGCSLCDATSATTCTCCSSTLVDALRQRRRRRSPTDSSQSPGSLTQAYLRRHRSSRPSRRAARLMNHRRRAHHLGRRSARRLLRKLLAGHAAARSHGGHAGWPPKPDGRVSSLHDQESGTRLKHGGSTSLYDLQPTRGAHEGAAPLIRVGGEQVALISEKHATHKRVARATSGARLATPDGRAPLSELLEVDEEQEDEAAAAAPAVPPNSQRRDRPIGPNAANQVSGQKPMRTGHNQNDESDLQKETAPHQRLCQRPANLNNSKHPPASTRGTRISVAASTNHLRQHEQQLDELSAELLARARSNSRYRRRASTRHHRRRRQDGRLHSRQEHWLLCQCAKCLIKLEHSLRGKRRRHRRRRRHHRHLRHSANLIEYTNALDDSNAQPQRHRQKLISLLTETCKGRNTSEGNPLAGKFAARRRLGQRRALKPISHSLAPTSSSLTNSSLCSSRYCHYSCNCCCSSSLVTSLSRGAHLSSSGRLGRHGRGHRGDWARRVDARRCRMGYKWRRAHSLKHASASLTRPPPRKAATNFLEPTAINATRGRLAAAGNSKHLASGGWAPRTTSRPHKIVISSSGMPFSLNGDGRRRKAHNDKHDSFEAGQRQRYRRRHGATTADTLGNMNKLLVKNTVEGASGITHPFAWQLANRCQCKHCYLVNSLVKLEMESRRQRKQQQQQLASGV